METAATQLEMIHERLGGDVGLYGIEVPDLVDTCVLSGTDNEGATAAFKGLVNIEIVPQLFVKGIESGADNGSSVAWDRRVYGGTCGRCERFIVLQFLRSFGG